MYVTLALAIVQSLAVAMYLPLKTGLNPGLVIAVNTMIMVAGAFFLVWLSDLKCRFGTWKFCCHHDGWDGYVPARRRDADPFKCQ